MAGSQGRVPQRDQGRRRHVSHVWQGDAQSQGAARAPLGGASRGTTAALPEVRSCVQVATHAAGAREDVRGEEADGEAQEGPAGNRLSFLEFLFLFCIKIEFKVSFIVSKALYTSVHIAVIESSYYPV